MRANSTRQGSSSGRQSPRRHFHKADRVKRSRGVKHVGKYHNLFIAGLRKLRYRKGINNMPRVTRRIDSRSRVEAVSAYSEMGALTVAHLCFRMGTDEERRVLGNVPDIWEAQNRQEGKSRFEIQGALVRQQCMA